MSKSKTPSHRPPGTTSGTTERKHRGAGDNRTGYVVSPRVPLADPPKRPPPKDKK